MKKIILLLFLLTAAIKGMCQFDISGLVSDSVTGMSISNVLVTLFNSDTTFFMEGRILPNLIYTNGAMW